MTIWPRARRCSARRSYNVGAMEGAKPSHPEAKTTAGCGPGASGRKVRYLASEAWAKLEDTERSSNVMPTRMVNAIPRVLTRRAIARRSAADVIVGIGSLPLPDGYTFP